MDFKEYLAFILDNFLVFILNWRFGLKNCPNNAEISVKFPNSQFSVPLPHRFLIWLV